MGSWNSKKLRLLRNIYCCEFWLHKNFCQCSVFYLKRRLNLPMINVWQFHPTPHFNPSHSSFTPPVKIKLYGFYLFEIFPANATQFESMLNNPNQSQEYPFLGFYSIFCNLKKEKKFSINPQRKNIGEVKLHLELFGII